MNELEPLVPMLEFFEPDTFAQLQEFVNNKEQLETLVVNVQSLFMAKEKLEDLVGFLAVVVEPEDSVLGMDRGHRYGTVFAEGLILAVALFKRVQPQLTMGHYAAFVEESEFETEAEGEDTNHALAEYYLAEGHKAFRQHPELEPLFDTASDVTCTDATVLNEHKAGFGYGILLAIGTFEYWRSTQIKLRVQREVANTDMDAELQRMLAGGVDS